ncbi:hypothetical protein BDV38DRAFT_269962 [Aspergillus pseudotamarii]|uniref:Methyltransferase domain-containing protein n=1 Tax=Aspergillus pseudotamarii TaxID=132259 RepID=A0A5N6T069_ASPPS|nr:uncharacterized protein BDV38DRAFT_269962 [Aspergillus pseudotamarii]KAE8139479.1 hypothetical protein BDV38DRAFT_269962 [Aspergillus pseudotamarii]
MAGADSYPLGRDIFHSVRLDAQHLLRRLHTGYIVYPCIPINDNLRIAELGTGTGVWLFAAAKYLPPTTQLDGFDISHEQFPLKEQCPPTLRFDKMDSFVDPPATLLDQYDVVHLPMWASVGETAKQFAAGINKLFGWVGLDYREIGFRLIAFERQQFQNNLINVCTNMHLLALHEILQGLRQSCPPEGILEHEIALHHLLPVERKGVMHNWSPVLLVSILGIHGGEGLENNDRVG